MAIEDGTRPQYTSFQQSFIQQVTREFGLHSAHLLLAPAGAGKSFALGGAVADLVRWKPNLRVLVLSPAALVPQWMNMLVMRELDAVAVDGRALRLQQVKDGDPSQVWPSGIYLMSVDLAKRNDALATISGVPWDLVVIDEAHLLSGQRMSLVETLAQAQHRPALLLATCIRAGVDELSMLSETMKLIDWTNDFERLWVESTGAKISRTVRPYRRSEEEIRIASQACAIARSFLTASDECRLRGMSLLRAAASSVSALEATLIRWIETSELDDAECGHLERLLEEVELLRDDSRLLAFKELVGELIGNGIRHAVVFCEFRTTLDYLAAVAERSELAEFVLHGGLSNEQRRDIVRSFEDDGGLLVTTTVATRGFSLSYVEAAIHYDLPLAPAAYAERKGRYHRYGRATPCTSYLFKDSSGALPFEDILVGMAQEVDVSASYPEFDQDELFRSAVK